MRTSSPVCRIFYGRKVAGKRLRNRVLVVTQDGTSYLAHHVVVTASIGHLKERHDRIFTPALNSAYRDAMAVINLFSGISSMPSVETLFVLDIYV